MSVTSSTSAELADYGTLYAFIGYSPEHGSGWWTFNSATGAVTDNYFDGAPQFWRLPPATITLGDLTLFVAADPTHGEELWAFEGSPGEFPPTC